MYIEYIHHIHISYICSCMHSPFLKKTLIFKYESVEYCYFGSGHGFDIRWLTGTSAHTRMTAFK